MGVERDFEGEFDVGSRDVDDVFDDFVVVMVDRGGETRRVDVDAGVEMRVSVCFGGGGCSWGGLRLPRRGGGGVGCGGWNGGGVGCGWGWRFGGFSLVAFDLRDGEIAADDVAHVGDLDGWPIEEDGVEVVVGAGGR